MTKKDITPKNPETKATEKEATAKDVGRKSAAGRYTGRKSSATRANY